MTNLDTTSTRERRIVDLRTLRIPGAVVLGNYRYAAAHSPLPLHRHSEMLEVCFLARGEQTYRVEHKEYRLRGGDVFITFPGEAHSTGPNPEERGELYWLILDMRPKLKSLLACERGESCEMRERLLALSPRHFHGSPRMAAILEDVFATFANRQFALRKTAVSNSLVRLLLEIIECNRLAQHSARLSSEIAAAQQYVEAHLTDATDLHTAALAERCGLSQSRFKFRFRAEAGVPPAEYVLRRKVEKARHLLVEEQTPILELALLLGFSSSQHFSSVFRRLTGKTPGQFGRNRNPGHVKGVFLR
jgi:AraC-like DNA-binding protein/quercetin dioxygenase-like cupin family protein